MSSSHHLRALLSFCLLGLALCAASCAATGAPRAKLVCDNDGYGKQCATLGQSFHSQWSWTNPVSPQDLARVDAIIDATVVTARRMQEHPALRHESFLVGKRIDGTYVVWGPPALENILEDIPETYRAQYVGERALVCKKYAQGYCYVRDDSIDRNLVTAGSARVAGNMLSVEIRAKNGPCLGYELRRARAEPELSPRRLGDRRNGWRCTSTIVRPSQHAASFL